jgi:uncharacterized protein (TIGR02145 family)
LISVFKLIIFVGTNVLFNQPKTTFAMKTKTLPGIMVLILLFASIQDFSQTTLDLKVFLEGPYFNGQMTTFLNWSGNIPLLHPYQVSPWYYLGSESVASVPNVDVVDWVLVELRQTTGAAPTATLDSVIARQAGFLLKDGKITTLDGISNLQLDVTVVSNLYVVVRHRNHLAVMSANPLQPVGGVYTYDFTSGQEVAYGGSNAHKQIGVGVWGMTSGDGDADAQVNNSDKLDVWQPQSGTSGYKAGDFNMNTQVDNVDKNDFWKVNSGRSSQVPGWATGNTPPVAAFLINPPAGNNYTVFTFDAGTSHDAQTYSSLLVVRWDWENDGAWDTPYSFLKTATHRYTVPGIYTTRLEVMDVGGLIGTIVHEVTVGIGIGCTGVDSVEYENKTYHTVEIGNQCWLKENLDAGVMINSSQNQADNGVLEKYCYNGNPAYCTTYGGLYQWDEMMQYDTTPAVKGICPDGWHLPDDNEWCILERIVDPTITCDTIGWRGVDGGGALKEAGTVHWSPPNTGATNSSGFTALPGGYRNTISSFYALAEAGLFWTSSGIGSSGWYHDMNYDKATIYRDQTSKSFGFSVRCLRDYVNLPPLPPSNPKPANGAANIEMPGLVWSCSDPNEDILTYDIYLGTSFPPPLVKTGHPLSSYSFSGILPSTTYYWKVVANDPHGASTAGPDWSFSTGAFVCGMTVIDTRPYGGGVNYPTIVIGDRCWMTRNMNFGWTVPGAENQSDNGIPEKYCYNDNIADCNTYGGLYQWEEMMQYSPVPPAQGICPGGWHLPTDAEWCLLEQYVDPTITCGSLGWRGVDGGGALKEAGTLHWSPPNTGATNSSGFTALPGGGCGINGIFDDLTLYGRFWSSSTVGSNAWRRDLHYEHADISRYYTTKGNAFSVRCLKDGINQPPGIPSNPYPPDGATGVGLTDTLRWHCTDPESPNLSYKVYFGLSLNPPLVIEYLYDSTYLPGSLIENTTYYWRITAVDVAGDTTEGPLWSFSTWGCGNTLLDPRDNQAYPTVQIGTQCWMAENLNIGTIIPGTTEQTNNGIIERYCYDNNIVNCDVYGGMYQWNEMMQYTTTPGVEGICPSPDGWHLPTDAEWCTLEQVLDPTITCNSVVWRGIDGGGRLKEAGTAHWIQPNTGATNSSDFTALPAGYRYLDGSFYVLDSSAYFWSSNESSWEAWYRILAYNTAQINRNDDGKYLGISVRCVKYAANRPPDPPFNPYPASGATGIGVTDTLRWQGSDPVHVVLHYKVYFGLTANPPLVMQNLYDTAYVPGPMLTDTTYYWRITAVDPIGDTAQGPLWTFSTRAFQCSDSFLDKRDNRLYSTVQIGTQCWMGENLNIGTQIMAGSIQTDNGIIEKYCYNDDQGLCDEYGGLYQWNETMQYLTTLPARGLCPENWHLPGDAEWCILEQFVDPTITCGSTDWRGVDGGGKLKEAGTAHWSPPNTGATNASGFTALPAGNYSIGFYGDLHERSYWWSSTGYGSNAYRRSLSYGNAQVSRYGVSQGYGFSVRCLLNSSPLNQPPFPPSDPAPADGATGVDINASLSWFCADPEGDTLTYDVYFGTDPNPPLVSLHQPDNTYVPGTMNYGTTHYWRIVAFDGHGNTTEGAVWSFTTEPLPSWQCGDSIYDTRDNQRYSTVQIGTQCWMAENLNIGEMIWGINQTQNQIIEKYCYEDNPANCDIYGGLYQWNEMMNWSTTPATKGICPDGWHVPTDGEYCTMTQYIDPTVDCNGWGWTGSDAGIKMKSTSGWSGGGNGTNTSGFTALPAGYCYGPEYFAFDGLNDIGLFYNSTEQNPMIYAWRWYLGYDHTDIAHTDDLRQMALSVRCVKNITYNQAPALPSGPIPADGTTNVNLDIDFSWECTDPENDPLSYDVYFGPYNPPPQVSAGQTTNTYDPGLLLYLTTYYWKIDAHDDQSNTTEGKVWSFITRDPAWGCGDIFVDPRTNHPYPTVQIGTQCWMAENLNIGKTILGVQDQTNNGVIEKYCYDDDNNDCNTYGGLYQWNEMMQYVTTPGAKGICPYDFHLPADEEWTVLTTYLGGESVAGGKMKEAGTVHWAPPNTGATNSSGFTALPAGNRGWLLAQFYMWSQVGSFYSSTATGINAWYRSLWYNSAEVGRSYDDQYNGFSVRCVHD